MYRLPKGKLTVSELLSASGINEMMEEVSKNATEIETCLIAYTVKGGGLIFTLYRLDTPELIYLLESIKACVMQKEWREKE